MHPAAARWLAARPKGLDRSSDPLAALRLPQRESLRSVNFAKLGRAANDSVVPGGGSGLEQANAPSGVKTSSSIFAGTVVEVFEPRDLWGSFASRSRTSISSTTVCPPDLAELRERDLLRPFPDGREKRSRHGKRACPRSSHSTTLRVRRLRRTWPSAPATRQGLPPTRSPSRAAAPRCNPRRTRMLATSPSRRRRAAAGSA